MLQNLQPILRLLLQNTNATATSSLADAIIVSTHPQLDDPGVLAPHSETVTFTEIDTNDLHSVEGFGNMESHCPSINQLTIPISPSGCLASDSCPIAPYPHYPLDLADKNTLIESIIHEGGNDCFPARSHYYFPDTNIYKSYYRPIHPGDFDPASFQWNWNQPSCKIDVDPMAVDQERLFWGAVYRLPTYSTVFQQTIQRGTTVILNGKTSDIVKYMVTIRRHISRNFSLVQLNAYTHDQQELEYNNPYWPTLLFAVPNELCEVPMPQELMDDFSRYIASPPSWWKSFWRHFYRSSHLLRTSGRHAKWDVRILPPAQ